MKKFQFFGLVVLAVAWLGGPSLAQDYPRHQPKPKPSPKAAASPEATPTPEVSPAATPKKPVGPLKMIKSDGKNKDSPIKVLKLDFYDSGFGSKYNSEVRVSCTIQNSAKEELKKVTLHLQILDGANQVIHEWKQNVGTMKAGQSFPYNPGVWYNSLGTNLHAGVLVEHEELPKVETGTTKK